MHRNGEKNGIANGLNRQQCEDCKQCMSIERRDGGPTRLEVHQELQEMEAQVPKQPVPFELDPREWLTPSREGDSPGLPDDSPTTE